MAKAKRTPAPDETISVKALVPITHDGDDYAVGDEIMVSQEQADQLIAVNAVALSVAAAE